MINKLHTILIIGFITFFSIEVLGQIRLPRLISDNVILQRDVELKLHGWSGANENVELLFKDIVFKTQANAKGEWVINLPAQNAGGPFKMEFSGTNKINIENILFGDVYLCSGQSNMELPMSRLRDTYPEEMNGAKNPNIRQFIVPDKYDFNKEHTDINGGTWKEVNTQSISEFSGVAYFFAKAIYQHEQIPIGLINTAVGGSPVSSWIDEENIKEFPELYQEHLKWKNSALVDSISTYESKAIASWYAELDQNDTGLLEEWFLPTVEKESWSRVEVPNLFADKVFDNKAGVVWFSKSIDLTNLPNSESLRLNLGRLVDMDQVYLNGHLIGETTYQYPPRKYDFKSNLLQLGKNEIVVRLINNGGEAGFIKDKAYELILDRDTLGLDGSWRYKSSVLTSNTPSQTFIRWKPVGLYNAMIAPLTNTPIKGVLWYQGESDTGNPELYTKTFPKLIESWRAHWSNTELPFIFVQLSNFMEETSEPQESQWAELREVQRKVNNTVPYTGMAVTIDIGEWNDIHPLNKKDVGERLALEARRLIYNEKLVSSGPKPKSVKLKGKEAIIDFENVDNGWMVQNAPPSGFTISEDGKHFYEAKAEILTHNSLKIYHQDIEKPKVVRYAWANNPGDANLYNKELLPAVPFQIELN